MKNYYSTHYVNYDKPKRTGYYVLPILPFLVGQPWDELALCLVESVKPACIRVTYGEEKTDAYTGRVTVTVDKNDIIRAIKQEVSVGLLNTHNHAWDLIQELRKRGVKV